VVAALLLRTVWTLAELLLAGLLYGGAPVLRKLAARRDLPAARN
jgi:hypothetical protein